MSVTGKLHTTRMNVRTVTTNQVTKNLRPPSEVASSSFLLRKKAKSDKPYRFRNLYRELNEELLLDSWRLLRKDAALGVDRVSAAEYEANLEENIHQLVERLKRKRYRARLVRRHYIPKGNGGVPRSEYQLPKTSCCNWQ